MEIPEETMMKRAPPVSSSLFSKSQNLWLIWKLLILLSIIFLVMTLARIQFYYDTSPQSSSGRVYRRSQLPMIDDEGFEGNPRIAYLFLVRRDLPLDFLWQSFFERITQFMFIQSLVSYSMKPPQGPASSTIDS